MIAHAAATPAVTNFSFLGASDQRSPTTPILANAPLVSSSLAIAKATTSHRAGTNQMASGAPECRRLPSGARGTGNCDLRLSSKGSICASSVASMCGRADASMAARGLPGTDAGIELGLRRGRSSGFPQSGFARSSHSRHTHSRSAAPCALSSAGTIVTPQAGQIGACSSSATCPPRYPGNRRP